MKYLTDAQVPQPFVVLLRKLEWDVRTVYDEGTQAEKEDVQHLINAREQGRVFVTFDILKGEEAAKVAAEMILNGGKIIEISRGPEQHLMRAIGKLLFHYPQWYPFLERNDGIAKIPDIRLNCKMLTPEEYSQTVSSTARRHFDEYIQHWQEKSTQPVHRRRRAPPAEQPQLPGV